MEMAGDLSGFNKWTGFLAYGPRWKETRKYMHHAIGTKESLTESGPLFESETRRFLKAVLRDPQNAQRHIRSYVVIPFQYQTRQGPCSVPSSSSAGAIIVLIAYGYQVQNKEDPMLALAESVMVQFKVFKNPGAYLVDFIPLCIPECSYFRTLESSLTCIDSKIRPPVVSRSWLQESSHQSKEAVRGACRSPVSIFCGGNGHDGCLFLLSRRC